MVILAIARMSNHRLMRYQDKENEEQFSLNLDLIDEVRMNVVQSETRLMESSGLVGNDFIGLSLANGRGQISWKP